MSGHVVSWSPAWYVGAGLVSLALQSRYDSIILEIVTFASAAAFFVRVFLGYKRMNDRSNSPCHMLHLHITDRLQRAQHKAAQRACA